MNASDDTEHEPNRQGENMRVQLVISIALLIASPLFAGKKSAVESKTTPPPLKMPTSAPSAWFSAIDTKGEPSRAWSDDPAAMTTLARAWKDYADGLASKARDAVEASPEYHQFDKSVADAQAKLDAARASHIDVLAASAAFGAARKPQVDMEAKAIKDDAAVQRATKIASEANVHAQYAIALQKYNEQQSAVAAAEHQKKLHEPLDHFTKGEVGIIRDPVRVAQVLDEHSFIGEYYNVSFIMHDYSTSGMIDGRSYSVAIPIEVGGTESYTTVLGAKRTVLSLKPAE